MKKNEKDDTSKDIVLERILECMGNKHGATKKLANYLDIHPNAVTNWKKGRTKSYKRYLKEIAEYFNVSVEYLEGKEDAHNLLTNDNSDSLSLRTIFYIRNNLDKEKIAEFDNMLLKTAMNFVIEK